MNLYSLGSNIWIKERIYFFWLAVRLDWTYLKQGPMIISQLLAQIILVGQTEKVLDLHILYKHLKLSHTHLAHYFIIELINYQVQRFSLSHAITSVPCHFIRRSNIFNLFSQYVQNISRFQNFLTSINFMLFIQSCCHFSTYFYTYNP